MRILKDSWNQIINDFKRYNPTIRSIWIFGVTLCLLGIADLFTLPYNYQTRDLPSKFAEMLTIMGIGLTLLGNVDSAFKEQLKQERLKKEKTARLVRIRRYKNPRVR